MNSLTDDGLVRDPARHVYDSRDEVLADGWRDAEYGWWVPPNCDTADARHGWIGLSPAE